MESHCWATSACRSPPLRLSVHNAQLQTQTVLREWPWLLKQYWSPTLSPLALPREPGFSGAWQQKPAHLLHIWHVSYP